MGIVRTRCTSIGCKTTFYCIKCVHTNIPFWYEACKEGRTSDCYCPKCIKHSKDKVLKYRFLSFREAIINLLTLKE